MVQSNWAISQQLRKWRRGVSMVEMLIAGAVLVIGLTGVTALLVHSFDRTRLGVRRFEASQNGTGAMETFNAQFTGAGFASIPAGTFDAGVVTNDKGIPLYGRTITVSPLLGDGGVPLPASVVQMDVTYTDSLKQTKTQRYVTIVNAPFAAPPPGP
jgi:hypothetical protein